MRLTSLVSSLILAVALSGCVSLRSVSQTQIPKQRTGRVAVESSKWIIFFLSFDNRYVDEMAGKLRAKCPSGAVRGVLTKDESINYFIGLVVKRRVTAEGYCLKA